jgi:hypothetical protein
MRRWTSRAGPIRPVRPDDAARAPHGQQATCQCSRRTGRPSRLLVVAFRRHMEPGAPPDRRAEGYRAPQTAWLGAGAVPRTMAVQKTMAVPQTVTVPASPGTRPASADRHGSADPSSSADHSMAGSLAGSRARRAGPRGARAGGPEEDRGRGVGRAGRVAGQARRRRGRVQRPWKGLHPATWDATWEVVVSKVVPRTRARAWSWTRAGAWSRTRARARSRGRTPERGPPPEARRRTGRGGGGGCCWTRPPPRPCVSRGYTPKSRMRQLPDCRSRPL